MRYSLYAITIIVLLGLTAVAIRAQDSGPNLARLGSGRAKRAASEVGGQIENLIEEIVTNLRGFVGDGYRKTVDDSAASIKKAIHGTNAKIAVSSIPIAYAAYIRSGGYVGAAIGAAAYISLVDPAKVTVQAIAALAFAVWRFRGLDLVSIAVASIAGMVYVGVF